MASPTPDRQNPKIAGQKLVPESTPKAGGKIRLPAPKIFQIKVTLLENLF